MPVETLLTIEGLAKTYPSGAAALSGFDLRVARGEFLSLVGPSGCGKSTALRLVAGLAEPTSGRVAWSLPDPTIGFVFQDPTLLPWARVWDNVYLPLRLQGVARGAAADRIDDALARVGLADRRDAYPRQLSGGMRMRAAIARALVTRPRVLLMDEPFAALDEITRSRLNDDLLGLYAQSDLTVLFVTHSVYESAYLSSRVAVMQAGPGRVVEQVEIDAPYPRGDDWRRDARYLEACRRTSAALQRATDPAPTVK
ncbi:ABC transporter ATP-binding protein [Botrimarina sp.]|uniref:ABC transporter ATP-binding protein n=1 Tax=Botrimarina sp. TaxID=2795802 RepID=UPI0032ECFDF3